METIQSKDGTPIAYQRSGSGPLLVLVHGTIASHRRWEAISPALAEHLTVYAVDRRGRGASGDAADYALEREFEDIAAVVDSIGEPASLLGHSFGGMCVLEAALRTPHARRVIAYEPPPAPVPEGILERLEALLSAGQREEMLTTFLREVVQMPPPELERFQATPIYPERVAAAHTLPREFRAVEGYRFEPERFKHLDIPVLLLLGGDSPPFNRENVEAWHAALPDSRIVVLPGQEHIAMDTAPDLFVKEVVNFLTEPN